MPEMAKVARERSRTAARSSSPAPAPALVPRHTPLATHPDQLRGLSPASRAAAVRNLQARVGNQAVARLLGEGSPPPAATHPDHGDQLVQREGRSSSGEQDADRGRTFVRSQAEPSAHAAQAVPASVADTVQSPGQPLQPTVRQEMASRLGADFAAVRTHTDAAASRSAEGIGARAYTAGSHIVFRAGKYQPSTPAGRQLLAHELTHVIQQRHGPPTGTDHGNGLTISNPADRFEREAEATAAQVMSGPLSQHRLAAAGIGEELTLALPPSGGSEQTLQRALHPQWATGEIFTDAVDPDMEGLPGADKEVPPQAVSIQRAYELCKETDVTHTSDYRAHKVRAENIHGNPLSVGSNPPTVNPFGWKELMDEGHTLGSRVPNSSHYNAVRMHLMNGRLGGPGNEMWNLAPGPAQVNSLMSAGPETAAKDLVSNGHTIWLETEVTYMNSSVNAHDFTSVVPHHIKMAWGAQDTDKWEWKQNIDLPVEPLQGKARREFEEWDENKTTELIARLADESDQVRAQVFDLVKHDTLRWTILENHPQIYRGMEQATKGKILKDVPLDRQSAFIDKLGIAGEANLGQEVLLPLAAAGAQIRAQEIFDAQSKEVQRKLLISYKWDLLQHLGASAIAWSKDWTIFCYNPKSGQANLLSQWNKSEIDTFFGRRSSMARVELLNLWAEYVGGFSDTAGKRDYVNKLSTVGDGYKKEYQKWAAKQIGSEEYLEQRPKRKRTSSAAGRITKPAKRRAEVKGALRSSS